MKRASLFACVAVVSLLAAPVTRAACPAAPTLVSPTGGATVPFGTVEFEWNSASGATAYELFLGLDGDAPSKIATVAGTTRKVVIDPGRQVKWAVNAVNVSCASGTLSAVGEFFTTCPTTPPTLRDPDKNSTFAAGDPITFRWTAVAGATSYDIKVTPDQGQTWEVLEDLIEGTSFTTKNIAAGDWGWYVRANFDSCDPLNSEPSNFFVVDCPTEAPELTQPADGQTGVSNPVELRWTAVENATKYVAWVSVDGGARTLAGETTSTRLLVTLSGKKVLWQVEAHAEGCATRLSNISEFTLDDSAGCPANPGKATLTSPADGAANLSSPVTFKWNAVSGATGYRVWALFSTSSEGTPLGFTTSTTLTADVPAGTGVWFVQTFFGDDCPTTLSDRRALTVTSGAQCENTPPQLQSPANGATGVDSPVEFRWDSVRDATKYSLWVSPEGSGDFSLYGTTEETTLTRLVPDGGIDWFVVAHFSACPEAKSATWSFVAGSAETCPTGEIALVTPADDATVTSPVHFSWTAVAGIEAYRVWVSVDGSAPVVVARRISTEADVALPAGEVEWYVEGLKDDCSPVLSDKGKFNVSKGTNCDANQAPALVSPVAPLADPGDFVVESPVTFEWLPSPGAIGYRLWLKQGQEPFADVELTTSTKVELDLEPAAYTWFVEALFAGCPSVKSQNAVFIVGSTEPRCETTAPALVLPGNGEQVTSPVYFSWTEVEGALKYRLFASLNGGEPLLIGATTDDSLERSLPPGAYVWQVEAVLDGCPSTLSEKESFAVVESGNCNGEEAELVSPANGSTNVASPVNFVWNPVSGATKYVLFLRVDDGAPTAAGSTTATSLSRPVPAGKVTWWVVAVFPGCEPEKSDEFTFTASRPSCDNARPILLAPDDQVVTSPARFAWTRVPDATGYQVWAWRGSDDPAIVASTTENSAVVDLAEGGYHWYVEALFADLPTADPPRQCPPTRSAKGEFVVGPDVPCGTPRKPVAKVVGRTTSGSEYTVRWTPLPNVELYELQESDSLDFSEAETITTSDLSREFSHEVTGQPVQYLYRVRGVSNCNDERGPYSKVAGTFVFPSQGTNASAEIGAGGPVVQKLFLPGGAAPVQFTATADKPWITINPSTGTLPVEGLTLEVTADADVLDLGTNTATISIVYAGAGKGPAPNSGTTSTVPFSVSLVTPVEPGGKGTPSPDSLIFPVVAHVNGANNSFFESDVRLTNLTAETMKYDVHFTPSGADGTVSGSSSSLEVEPGMTIALDDVLSSFFGEGTTSGAFGVLEVRPQTTSEGSGDDFLSGLTSQAIRRLDTAASSRTYQFTPAGTYGQFIPAIPFSDFAGVAAEGTPPSILSLQQVAESAAYRANFGFAEASGNPVSLVARVYDVAGTLLSTIPVSLGASQHQQINGMLALNGIQDLNDGRVEVEVTSGTGKVTAYVSEVDNRTNDPLLVSAVPKGSVASNRYVVPGAGYVNNGAAFWVTDMRVFNAGTAPTTATLTFHPMKSSPGTAATAQITLDAGEIEVIDNVLGNLFAQPNGAAGSVSITTPATTTLTATARTYNQTSNGTYGQFIPGVTPAQSIGLGDRALQILQVEQSSRFRTNIGLAETSGAPATVEVTAFVPDSLVSVVVPIPLAANEFFQFPLSYLGPQFQDGVYNARVSVRVIDGAGRITAYGSAIDAVTQDPTYVPAQ